MIDGRTAIGIVALLMIIFVALASVILICWQIGMTLFMMSNG